MSNIENVDFSGVEITPFTPEEDFGRAQQDYLAQVAAAAGVTPQAPGEPPDTRSPEQKAYEDYLRELRRQREEAQLEEARRTEQRRRDARQTIAKVLGDYGLDSFVQFCGGYVPFDEGTEIVGLVVEVGGQAV